MLLFELLAALNQLYVILLLTQNLFETNSSNIRWYLNEGYDSNLDAEFCKIVRLTVEPVKLGALCLFLLLWAIWECSGELHEVENDEDISGERQESA